MFGSVGPQEILLVLVLVLLLFGAKKIPEIMRGFGQGLREFKRASNDIMGEIDRAGDMPEPPKKAAVSAAAPQTDEGRVNPEGGSESSTPS